MSRSSSPVARPASGQLRITAIIAAYNEADIIAQVIADYIAQGVDVVLLDNHSTDGTAAEAKRFLGKGLLRIEPFPERRGEDDDRYPWERILLRKEAIANELDSAWIIHADADEFRESPFPGMTLSEAIQHVDALGYNAIDFTTLNFWPTDDSFMPGDDVRERLRYYETAQGRDKLQVRSWKKTGKPVDLASSGGHQVLFPGRKIFPIRFILRHYPIRGQAHAERKIFHERKPRFLEAEREKGWHIQYDAFAAGQRFVRDPEALTLYDAGAVRMQLTNRSDKEMEEQLAEELHDWTRHARALSEEVVARDEELGRQRHEAEAHNRELEVTRRELEVTRGELEAHNRELEVTRRELEAARQHAQDDLAEKTELLSAVLAREAELEGLRQALDHERTRLDLIYDSRTWRWAAPARAAWRIVKRE